MLNLAAALICDPGKHRRNNQDNYLFDGQCLLVENQGSVGIQTVCSNDEEPFIAAVFDGMGGYSNGEIAAAMAAEALRDTGTTAFSDTGEIWFVRLNEEIHARAAAMRVSEMGTTLAAVMLANGLLRVVNVGDSRVYLYRGKKLYRLSEDHTNAQMLEELGMKNRKPELTQYLGMDPEIRIMPFFSQTRLLPNDAVLLCSDGLYEALDERDILCTVRSTDSPALAIQLMQQLARARGAKDNITALLISVAKET